MKSHKGPQREGERQGEKCSRVKISKQTTFRVIICFYINSEYNLHDYIIQMSSDDHSVGETTKTLKIPVAAFLPFR